MKLGLRGSKWDPYLQYHKINNKLKGEGGPIVAQKKRKRERERERRGKKEGKKEEMKEGDERGEEEGERGGEEEGEEDGEEGGEEEREERGTVKERIDWWLVRGVLRERLLLGK